MSATARYFIIGLVLILAFVGSFSGAKSRSGETPQIVSIRLEPETLNLVFQVEGGAFDPILSLVPFNDNLFNLIIEGEGVQLGPMLKDESKKLASQLKASVEGVQSFQLSSSGSAELPGFKLTIQTRQRIQPQIRSNTGSLVTLSLQGAKAVRVTTTDVTRSKQEALKRRSKQATSIELPTITLDPKKEKENPSKRNAVSPLVGPSPSAINNTGLSQSGFSVYAEIQNPRVDGVIRQAWGEYRQGRLNSGQMMLESYLSQRPKDHLARYLLALIHLAGDENQRATMALQKTLKQNEYFLPAWIDLVRLNLKEGNFSETEELLKQSLVLFPGQPDLLYAKGLLLEAQGEVPQAKDFYLRVLARDSRHWLAHYRLAITELKANHPQAAMVELKRILNANPDDIAALKALGYAYHRDNNVTKALREYRHALKPDVLINFAGLLREENQQANALALYGAAEVIAPDDPDIQYNLGMLYVDMNQPEPAIRTLSRFVELAKKNPKGFLGDDERVTRATTKLRTFGVSVPSEKGVQSSSDNKKKALDYQFGVSATDDGSVPH